MATSKWKRIKGQDDTLGLGEEARSFGALTTRSPDFLNQQPFLECFLGAGRYAGRSEIKDEEDTFPGVKELVNQKSGHLCRQFSGPSQYPDTGTGCPFSSLGEILFSVYSVMGER